ncbi:hypothetical protein ACFYXC_10770 [Streptomyces sp. NPDC002701]|uniref:hypothetical protein n=1 Tax=Streptomyces sp. NPDC002701 TaxID=3364661 RepID=UPI0036CE19FE
MGEREGGDPRPHHHGPSGAPGPEPDLAALLTAAVLDAAVDPDAEKRALAAFREARDEGAHGEARTRRRDDWRPAGERRRGWSVRATLVALAASVTLGGVAVAGIGSGVGAGDGGGGRDRPRPPESAPAGTPGPSGPPEPGRTDGFAGPSDRPSGTQDSKNDKSENKDKNKNKNKDKKKDKSKGKGKNKGEDTGASADEDAKKPTKGPESTKSAKGEKSAKPDKTAKSTKSAKREKPAKGKGR